MTERRVDRLLLFFFFFFGGVLFFVGNVSTRSKTEINAKKKRHKDAEELIDASCADRSGGERGGQRGGENEKTQKLQQKRSSFFCLLA
jgi:hypothetical protein